VTGWKESVTVAVMSLTTARVVAGQQHLHGQGTCSHMTRTAGKGWNEPDRMVISS